MSDPVRPLVIIAALDVLGVLGVLVADIVAVVGGTHGLSGAGEGTALVGILMWVIVSAAIGLILVGLHRRRAVARTPFLLIQAFSLALVPLFFGSDVVAWRIVAILIAVLAVSGIVLALRPAVREVLA
jgi:hypothetical protein